MTIEACRNLASNRFVSSFGLAEGNQCLLDPANSNVSYLERYGAAADCTTPCSGDSRVVCGGRQQFNLYLENDQTLRTVPPLTYTPTGCFRDDASARRMTLLWDSASSMTLELCAAIAYSEQWLLFGLEGGTACYGGQAPDSAKALGPSSTCTLACSGDVVQYCGGTLALNLYTLQDTPWLKPADTTPADSTPGPKTLVDSNCVGAAAASQACQGAAAKSGAAGGAASSAARLMASAAALAGVLLLVV